LYTWALQLVVCSLQKRVTFESETAADEDDGSVSLHVTANNHSRSYKGCEYIEGECEIDDEPRKKRRKLRHKDDEAPDSDDPQELPPPLADVQPRIEGKRGVAVPILQGATTGDRLQIAGN